MELSFYMYMIKVIDDFKFKVKRAVININSGSWVFPSLIIIFKGFLEIKCAYVCIFSLKFMLIARTFKRCNIVRHFYGKEIIRKF